MASKKPCSNNLLDLLDFYSPVIDPCSSLIELNMWRTKLVIEHIVIRSGL
jgi:hypothetical protein